MTAFQSMAADRTRNSGIPQSEDRNNKASGSGTLAGLPRDGGMDRKTYAERLRMALDHAKEARGYSVNKVAEEVGMRPSTLYEAAAKGIRPSSYTVDIARITGVSAEWLATGTGPMLQTETPANVTPVEVKRRRVPLVSSVAAGLFSEAIDYHPAGWSDEWVECTVPVKDHTFALKVEGDSMEPKFEEGRILIVEPDTEARPGDYVIAKNGDNEATFKQLIRDGGDFFLKPLNPRYPIRPLGDAKIIGVVVQSFENYR
jgi:SOS-response transcriptional repressor LexA